jgi:hypothetical protein
MLDGGAVGAPANRGETTMAKAQISLMTLSCVKKQDTFGKDEVIVELGGDFHSGPHKIGKNGDDVGVGGGFTDFEDKITITLKEKDDGDDDVLGSWTAYATETDGIRRAHFHALSGADYHLTYDVDAA